MKKLVICAAFCFAALSLSAQKVSVNEQGTYVLTEVPYAEKRNFLAFNSCLWTYRNCMKARHQDVADGWRDILTGYGYAKGNRFVIVGHHSFRREAKLALREAKARLELSKNRIIRAYMQVSLLGIKKKLTKKQKRILAENQAVLEQAR